MKSQRRTPARPGAQKPAANRRPPVPNPFAPATRHLAKRLLQFAELPEPERTRAYNAWLNTAGSPKRNTDRQNRVREFYALMKAIAKKLSPRDRASMRALGKAILPGAASRFSRP